MIVSCDFHGNKIKEDASVGDSQINRFAARVSTMYESAANHGATPQIHPMSNIINIAVKCATPIFETL